MSLKFTNNAASTLAAGYSNSATSMTVATGQGALFPTLSGSETFQATIIRASDSAIEIVTVTARATDVMTVTRAQEGTTGLTLLTGDRFELHITAAFLNLGAVTSVGLSMATGKMLGRATAGTGSIEEIATTGTGSAVLAATPTLVTPVLGVATATSVNKMAITAPATSSTLAVADGKTLTASNTLTLAGTDSTTMTFPAASDTIAGLGTAGTFTKAQRGAYVTLTDASTIAIDMSLGNNFTVTLVGNRTFGVPTNAVSGQAGLIEFRQDATGGRTMAWPWIFSFAGGTSFALTILVGFCRDLVAYSVSSFNSGNPTLTIATPCVVTLTAHGLYSGDKAQLTTSGALPTGLAINTTYWLHVIDANTFHLSTSKPNAAAGTYIATTGSQSGTHSIIAGDIGIVIAKDWK